MKLSSETFRMLHDELLDMNRFRSHSQDRFLFTSENKYCAGIHHVHSVSFSAAMRQQIINMNKSGADQYHTNSIFSNDSILFQIA